jgi:hypothetical protein
MTGHMAKKKCLSKKGCLAAYDMALQALRRTNPKEPLLEIRAWVGVAQTQIVLFSQSIGIKYFVARTVVAIAGLVCAPIYWALTVAVRIFGKGPRFP